MKQKAFLFLAFVMAFSFANAQINIPSAGIVKETFNALGTSSAASLPSGWTMSAAGVVSNWPGANTAVDHEASSGTPTASGRYNWGTAGGTDRAVGFITDGSYASPNTIVAQYSNQTGNTITAMTITFQVERYRVNTGAFYLQFSSSGDGSSWTSQTGGDISVAVFATGASAYTFSTPQTVYKTVTLSGLTIASGASYYLRWVFGSVTANAQGLGLDNVSLSVNTAAPNTAATLSDGLAASQQAKQGDELTYTATITNKGQTATGVQYNATLDANTTLTNGSLTSSPLASDDDFTTSLNTALTNGNVLVNDFGLPSRAVLAYGNTESPAAVVTGQSATTDNGGTVVMTSNGGFTYTPPQDFAGYDKFAYTLSAGLTPNDIGVVTIAVGTAPAAGAPESFPGVIGNVPVTSAPSLTANDLGDGLAIVAINTTAVTGFPFTTSTAHGDLTINANGTFTYNPAAGYEGTDNFTYTIDNGFSAPQSVTVALTVTGMIWFIDNTYIGSIADGRLQTPFKTLAAFQALNNGSGNNPAAGDYIFVTTGSGNYIGGITLLNNQKLIGAGATPTLGSITGYTVPSYSASLPATGGTRPALSAFGTVITLANGNTVQGIGTSGGTNSVLGASTAGLTFRDNSLSGASLEALKLTAASGTVSIIGNTIASTGNSTTITTTSAGGALTLDFSTNTLTSGATGISIDGSAGGGITITGFADNSVNGNTTGSGIVVTSAKFDATPGGGYNTVAGGTMLIGASGNSVGGSGMSLSNVSGDLSFTDLDIYADGGVGLRVTGTGAVNTLGGTGLRFVVPSGVSVIEATGGPAVDVTNASFALPLATLKSTNSLTTGISLVNAYDVTGFTLLSTTSTGSVNNSTSAAVNIDGGTGTISIDMPVTVSVGRAVSVINRGSNAITFSKAVTSNSGTGVFLNNNTGATINFSGGVTLSTGSNDAFTATGGGTVNVTGAINVLSTTTGTAVNIQNTSIGSSGITFKSISANGGANGIVLNNVGTNGFTVTGDGINKSTGGTIQNTSGSDGATAGNGIYLNNAGNISLSFMQLNDHANNAVLGTGVRGFSLNKCRFTGNNGTSNSGTYNESVVKLTDIGGAVSFRNSFFSGGAMNTIRIENIAGTAPTIDSLIVDTDTLSTMQGSTADVRGTALLISLMDGKVATRISNNNITYWWGNAIHVLVQQNATSSGAKIYSNFCDNTNGALAGAGGIWVAGGPLTYTISNNIIRHTNGTAISADRASQGTLLTGAITGNTIGVSGDANSGSGTGIAIFASHTGPGTTTTTINNNTIRQVNGSVNGAITANIGDDVGGGGNGTMNITIQGNDIQESGTLVNNAQQGILIVIGKTTGDQDNACINIGGAGGLANTILNFNAGSATNSNGIRINQRFVTTAKFPGYTGGQFDNTALATYLLGRNTASHSVNANSGAGGGFQNTSGGAACSQ